MRILFYFGLAAALLSVNGQRHRRNLQTCECACDLGEGEDGVGILLNDAEIIVKSGGQEKLCVPSEKAAEYFLEEKATCDTGCAYEMAQQKEEEEESPLQNSDLDALDF